MIWIYLDTQTKTATLIKAINYPTGVSVESQGNAQALPNGDTFVGWGQAARVSEFDRQGKLLFDAPLTAGNNTYRAYRAEWAGQPDTPPTATAWRIFAGPTATSLSPIRTVPWNGLDTTVRIAGLPQEVKVVALDARGAIIGTSQPVRVG